MLDVKRRTNTKLRRFAHKNQLRVRNQGIRAGRRRARPGEVLPRRDHDQLSLNVIWTVARNGAIAAFVNPPRGVRQFVDGSRAIGFCKEPRFRPEFGLPNEDRRRFGIEIPKQSRVVHVRLKFEIGLYSPSFGIYVVLSEMGRTMAPPRFTRGISRSRIPSSGGLIS